MISGEDLQAAIDSASLGDEIVLEVNAVFTGPFTLPDKGSGTDWITIRSASLASLPEGVRVSPGDNLVMAAIEAPDFSACFNADANAHHYRMAGLEIRTAEGAYSFGLNNHNWTNHHFIYDRCYMHGQNTVGCRRSGGYSGNNMAIIDSYLDNFWETGADSQAIWILEGHTFLFHNNYLEAAAECFLSGGATHTVGRMPEDITITRNTFEKRLTWKDDESNWDGINRSIKNLLEFKTGRRVLVEGNDFLDYWIDEQRLPIVFKSTNQGPQGANPDAQVEHVTYRYNYTQGAGSGINITQEDSQNQGVEPCQNILIEHNLTVDMALTRPWSVSGGRQARGYELTRQHSNIVIRHNTLFMYQGPEFKSAMFWLEGDTTGLVFQDNLVAQGRAGLSASGFGADHLGVLAKYAPDAVFTNNVMWSSEPVNQPGNYPPGNLVPVDVAAVGFENYIEGGGGDYSLSASSIYKGTASDGTDPGVNFDLYNVART